MRSSIPPSVEQTATRDQLGSFVQDYEFSGIAFAKKIGIGFACLCTGGLFGLIPYSIGIKSVHSLSDGSVLVGLILLALALVLSGLWLIINSLMALIVIRQKIYLFEQGLIILRAGRTNSYLWTQVKDMWQEVTHHYKQKSYSGARTTYEGTEYHYKFLMHDGRKLHLSNTTEDISFLGEKIVQKVVEAQWLDALAALKANHTVAFDRLSLSAEGIIRNGSNRILPWREVDEVRVEKGSIKIRTDGKLWYLYTFAAMPNANLFLALSKRMLAQHGGSVSSTLEDDLYRRLRALGEHPY